MFLRRSRWKAPRNKAEAVSGSSKRRCSTSTAQQRWQMSSSPARTPAPTLTRENFIRPQKPGRGSITPDATVTVTFRPSPRRPSLVSVPVPVSGTTVNIRCAMRRWISSPYSAGWIHFLLHLVPGQGSQCRGGASPSCGLQIALFASGL
jgi:hypothetical protein